MSRQHGALAGWTLRTAVLVFSAALGHAPALASAGVKTDAGECYTRQDLAARSNGFLARVLVRDGQPVKAGDLIAELDSRLLKTGVREAKAGVAAAKANVDLARDGWQRLQQLAATKTASQQELIGAQIRLSQAQAQYEQAKALLERTEIQLDDTKIKAEIDGQVSGLPLVKGLYVQAGNSLGRVEAAASACAARH